MQKSIILLFFIITIFFSSCFEVVEEVSYNNDKSGTYILTINGSQSKTRIKTLLELDTFMGADMPDKYDIRKFLDSIEYTIIKSSRSGISAVRKNIDFNNYIFSISFNFNNTETLNLAINNVAKFVSKKDSMNNFEMFRFSQNNFERKVLLKENKTEIPNKYKDAVNQISEATITSIYRFPSPVKSVKNKKAKISKSGKAVMQKQQLKEIINNPQLFQNTINF